MECWPRWADPTKDSPYEGWPKTINQLDNYGREAFAYLPVIKVEGTENPVVSIKDEESGETVYTIRIKGSEFKPKVFKQGSYEITVTDTVNDTQTVLEGVKPTEKDEDTLLVKF